MNHAGPGVPDWIENAVFYQIFPDRFARSPQPGLNLEPWESQPTLGGFKGGNFAGIKERLSYLADLGVNALYFTPVFESPSNHRYHTHDYFKIDPILGGNLAFRSFLDQAHALKIRVILDGVFNHASRSFLPFAHTLENGASSPYKDWFFFNEEWLESGRPLHAFPSLERKFLAPKANRGLELYGFECWWDLPALPKLNTNHPAVRDYIFEVAEFWIDFGIDGWRLDVPHEIDDDDFWREFRHRVKRKNPEAYIVGELWGDASRWLQGDQFDGTMNYLFGKAILGGVLCEKLDLEVAHGAGGYRDMQPLATAELVTRLNAAYRLYHPKISRSQLNVIGSHDTPRLMSCASGDLNSVKLAFSLMFVLPGAPCIYYGDEVGMLGLVDPDCRRSFSWETNDWSLELHAHVKELIAQRHELIALRKGEFVATSPRENVLVIERFHVDQTVRVFFNLSFFETIDLGGDFGSVHPRSFQVRIE